MELIEYVLVAAVQTGAVLFVIGKWVGRVDQQLTDHERRLGGLEEPAAPSPFGL